MIELEDSFELEDKCITIEKINHAYIRIYSDMDVAMEISDAFKFLLPNYKFMPAYKSGKFDGYIRLFNLGSRLMASGLLHRLLDYCNERNIKYSFKESEYSIGEDSSIEYDAVQKYMENLNLTAHGEKIEIRDYQVNGVYCALRYRCGILNAATGSGKSLVVYSIIRYITEELSGRVLIIVPTVGLTTQLKSDFEDYASATDYNVNENVHLISAGVSK